MTVRFWEYKLTAQSLCLGERNKKGTYRSSIDSTIPYSQITGALRARYGVPGHEGDLLAVGLLERFQRHRVVQGVRDRVLGRSTLPIEAEILINVVGRVYVVINDYTVALPDEIEHLKVGAFRSRGVGECTLQKMRGGKPLEIPEKRLAWGNLTVRLPAEEEVWRQFGILQVDMPVWGYLFQPDERHVGGRYVRALFEGSRVLGPKLFVR